MKWLGLHIQESGMLENLLHCLNVTLPLPFEGQNVESQGRLSSPSLIPNHTTS